MELRFCDRCSCRVTEGDLAEGRAVQVGEFCFCKPCWDDSEIREAMERLPGGLAAAQGTGAASTPSKKSERHQGSRVTRRKTPRSKRTLRKTPARGTTRVRPQTPHGRRHTPTPAHRVDRAPAEPDAPAPPVAAVEPARARAPRDRGSEPTSTGRPAGGSSGGVLLMVGLFALVGMGVGFAAIMLSGKSDAGRKDGSQGRIGTVNREPGPRGTMKSAAAYAEADAYAVANPKDIAGRIRRYEAVVRDHPTTPEARRAKVNIIGLRSRSKPKGGK